MVESNYDILGIVEGTTEKDVKLTIPLGTLS